MKNKRLLFITTRRFWPIDSGRKLSLYYYSRGLHDIFGYELYIYSFLEAGQTPENGDDKPSFIHSVTYAKDIPFLKKIGNIICKSVLSRKKLPFQCSMFYSKENAEAIRALAEDIAPQAIIVDMVRLAPYYSAFSHLECKKVLDMDDILSKRYRRQIQFKDTQTNLMGAFANKSKKAFNKLANSRVLKKAVLKREARLMEDAEKRFTEVYDSVILVSERETEYLNRLTGSSKASTITIGADYKYFAQSIDMEKEQNTLSFVGNLKIAANADSLDMIIAEIMPLMKRAVKLYVVGYCPDEIKEKYKSRGNVVFTGMVDDLRTYVKKTQVFLSPIAYGSGIKTKVLEAMAMGMPIVTNSIGAEGLAVTDGQELFIRESCEEISQAVNRLLDDETLRKEMGERSQEFVRQHHDWNRIYKAFEKTGL